MTRLRSLLATTVIVLVLAATVGSTPVVVAQDGAQEGGSNTTPTPEGVFTESGGATRSIYLPLVTGGRGGDTSRPNSQQAIDTAATVIGEEPQAQIGEKPAGVQDDVSSGQVPPPPGLEPPESQAAELKGSGIDAEAVLAPAATNGWTTIMSEGFEGVFPSGSWRLLDSDGTTNGEYLWDDESYKPYAGAWSGWPAGGGANALNPATYNYPNNMRSWMIYGPFDLSNSTDANLTFNYWNQSEASYDTFQWLASINGANFSGYQVSGDSGGWRSVTFDLKTVPTLGNLVGKSSVWIAFYFGSDSSVTGKGPFVDNVTLQKLVNTTTCPNQYKAEYFNNRTLSGTPTVTRCENWPIKYDWGTGSPVSGVGSDNFSVRWTGSASVGSGSYVFAARADDGINVWLDNTQIINGWVDQGPTSYSSIRTVATGQRAIKVEYYESGGGALAEFRWFAQPDVTAARNQLKTMPDMTSPWRQINAPIQNSAAERQSVMYASAIDQFEVTWQEFSGRYKPGGAVPDTRCNIYAGDVMRAMRVALPTKGELGVGTTGSQWTDPMTANARNLNEFLNGQRTSTNTANNGWRLIDPTTSQGLQQLITHLRDGRPALASNVGHIAVLRPVQDGVTRWQDLRIAQAGAKNFMNDRLEVGLVSAVDHSSLSESKSGAGRHSKLLSADVSFVRESAARHWCLWCP